MAHLACMATDLLILACCVQTSAETERLRECKHTLNAMKDTPHLEDLLHLSKSLVRAPTNNFLEFKINIAMFMAFVWILFGADCNYY